MAEQTKNLAAIICDIAENSVLHDGWIASENDMREVLKRENTVQRFKKAFVDAVMKNFSETIDEMFEYYKLARSIERVNAKPSLSDNKWLIKFTDKEDVNNCLVARASAKRKIKEKLQSLIETELQLIGEIKQRLKFRMSVISEKKIELNNLLEKKDQIISILEKNNKTIYLN